MSNVEVQRRSRNPRKRSRKSSLLDENERPVKSARVTGTRRKRVKEFAGMENYTFEKQIGEGADCVVMEYRLKPASERVCPSDTSGTTKQKMKPDSKLVMRVAVKELVKDRADELEEEELSRAGAYDQRCLKWKNLDHELQVYRTIGNSHPNFPKLYHVDFSDDLSVRLFMELGRTTLWDFVCDGGHSHTPVHRCRTIMRQLISALSFLHDRNILHGDIKPSNILMFPNCHIKLTDFNRSVINFSERHEKTDPIGTWCYNAPEILCGYKKFGYSADVWSAGMVMLHLWYGRMPVCPESGCECTSCLLKLVSSIVGRPPKYLLRKWFKTPPRASQYNPLNSSKRWQPMPDKEMKTLASDILSRQKLMRTPKALDFLQCMVCWDPDKRWSASQLLKHPFLAEK